MDKNYFMIINGKQCGPFPVSQLIENGLTQDTMVWTNGMADWQTAASIPELNHLLWEKSQEDSAFGTYAQNYDSPYGGNQPISSQKPHTNWMPWAIAGTVFGFLFSCIGVIFGVIGIIQANKANKAYAYGDNQTGDTANSTAKVMSIIALVLGVIGVIGSILIWAGIISTNALLYYN